MRVEGALLRAGGVRNIDVGCMQINAVFAACKVAEATAAAPGGAVKLIDANEAMIHESAADAQRAMTGTACAYPVQLKKAWVEDGAASGWRLMRDFQKEAGGQSFRTANLDTRCVRHEAHWHVDQAHRIHTQQRHNKQFRTQQFRTQQLRTSPRHRDRDAASGSEDAQPR